MKETGILLTPDGLAAARGVRADLVYLGSEFCENLLPTPAQFKRARALPGKRAVLVTPLLTERGLKKAEAVVRSCAAAGGLEVVVNDLGLAGLLAKKYPRKTVLSAGRVLAGILSASPDPFLARLFKEHGIARLEADRAETVERFSRLPGLRFTFHAPYAYAGLTRFCPWEKRWTGGRCGFSCRRGPKKLASRLLPEPLYLIGAGYFTAGGKPGGGPIDRVVYDPAGKL